MTVRQRGANFQVDLMLDGQRIRSTFETEVDAMQYEHEVRIAHKLGKPLPRHVAASRQVRTMGELLALTADRWRGRKAEKTSYMQARLYVDHCGPNAPIAPCFTNEAVSRFVLGLCTTKAGGTINRRLSGISALAEAAVEQRIIAEKPKLKWQRETGARLRFYSEAEERELLATARRLGHPDYAALFAFLVDTGARLGEAEKLTWADVPGGYVTFRDTKNGTTRRLPLTRRARNVVDHFRPRGGTGPFAWLRRHVLRSVWAQLRGVLPWLGEDGVVHTFRHTCASRLVQRGHDLYHVQQWMGHKSPTVTQRYAHLSPKTFGAMADSLDGVVGTAGLEPARPGPTEPKSAASANSATTPTQRGPPYPETNPATNAVEMPSTVTTEQWRQFAKNIARSNAYSANSDDPASDLGDENDHLR